MQDQVGTGGLLWTLEAPVTINLPTLLNPFNVKRYLLQYLLSGQGLRRD